MPRRLADGDEVTVSCAEGDTGFVYRGILPFEEEVTRLDSMPEAPVKIMMNVGTPDQAFSFSRLPHRGVGLARLEFIINRQIGIHPRRRWSSTHWRASCAPAWPTRPPPTTRRATTSCAEWRRACR
jgi:phosphoenolpyruvate synthase/pyruvate phosphate dikinase